MFKSECSYKRSAEVKGKKGCFRF